METGNRDEELRELVARQLAFFRELGVTHLNPLPQSAGMKGDPPGPVPSPVDWKPASPPPDPGSITAGRNPEAAAVELVQIRQDLGDCQRCKLAPLRRHLVFGVGDPAAELMFIGEAPGEDEDLQGEPFVGRAGQLLTRIIEAMQLRRDQVYIANILKCRPPQNRDPEPDEVACCEPFLHRQIAAVRPLVIVALGRCAAQTLLRTETPISRLRGRFFEYRDAWLLPTFHPSYLLRNPAAKKDVWEDMKKVMERLRSLGSRYY
ncbi:MAG: uracil-DNA glycosylase [Acidobacteriota bacterium]